MVRRGKVLRGDAAGNATQAKRTSTNATQHNKYFIKLPLYQHALKFRIEYYHLE
jgi:hypothetical protein